MKLRTFLPILFFIVACNNSENTAETENPESKKAETETIAPEQPAEFASHEFVNTEFGTYPFKTRTPKTDLLKTAFKRVDTLMFNPKKKEVPDTIFNFRYDDQSEISLYSIDGRQFIAFAALASPIIPLKRDLAVGMNKKSFYASFEELKDVSDHYNIFRIMEPEKIVWTGFRFKDNILQVVEYRGSIDKNWVELN